MSSARSPRERSVRARAAALFVFPERRGLAWGALTNVVTTTISYLLAPHAQLANLMIIHLIGAVLISTRYGMAVSTFTAATGALAFDYFCIPPVWAFAMPNRNDVITFAGLMGLALFVCWLNQGVREQTAAAKASEDRTHALCQLSLDLSQVTTSDELFARAECHLRELFGEGCRLSLLPETAPLEPAFEQHPVTYNDKVLGYIRVIAESVDGVRDDRGLLLAAVADRIADALKLLGLVKSARQAEVDAEVERNRSALLSAVSHDMKTPLSSIMTAGSSLLSAPNRNTASARELLETIVQESERMNAMITNLLSVTRLESGRAVLNREDEALDDLLFAVLSRFSARLAERRVTVDIPDDLPLLSVDPVLVDHLLVNLLENALRYTPAQSPLEIRGRSGTDCVEVELVDHGPGISVPERERVFEKFFRGQAARQNDGGTGLGLTICRAIVQAHGGQIGISPTQGGGLTVRVSLPVAKDAAILVPGKLERSAEA